MSDVTPTALPAAEDVPRGESKGVGSDETPAAFCALPDTTRQVRIVSLEQWMDLCA
jgi:hypothetical protein